MDVQIALTRWLSELAAILPLGYTFGAGMVAAVNPCGFAMLPAYLSIYLGLPEQDQAQRARPVSGLLSATWIGASVSSGFMVLFVVAGLILAAGGSFLLPIMPWIGTGIGLLLVVLGLLSVTGRTPTVAAVQQLGDRIMPGTQRSGRTFFLFGVAYGVASLSCTIPIFMIAAGSALASASFADGLVRVLSYALGMASVVVSLTLALALFKGGVAKHFRRALPYVHLASAFLLMLAGGWIVIYWSSSLG